MTYNPNVPLGNQTISSTQAPIQTNFDQANIGFAIDHSAFTDNTATQGMHKKVTYRNVLGADPGATTPIATTYTKVSPSTSTSDLYYQNGSLAANVVQLTGGGITTAAWGRFSASPVTLADTYNITSIIVNSPGNYTITFTRIFSNTNYAFIAMPSIGGSQAPAIEIISRSTSQLNFVIRLGGTPTDSGDIDFVCFGKLA